MTPEPPITVFVTIGNVQGALNAQLWAKFHGEIAAKMDQGGAIFQGEWFCGPLAAWQNACWCIDVQVGIVERLKGELAAIGVNYGRGAVAWSEVARTDVLG